MISSREKLLEHFAPEVLIRLGLGDLSIIFSAEDCGMLVCNSKSETSWWMTWCVALGVGG